MARGTSYKEEYDNQAFRLTLLGFIDKDLAEYFGVKEQTINNWKNSNPSFFESIKKGKADADGKVTRALFKKACGFTKRQVKIFQFQGTSFEHEYDEYYPPDTAAAFIWLKNRQPKYWRDKKDDIEDDEIPKTVDFNFTVIANAS